jgi:hypothetical protein
MDQSLVNRIIFSIVVILLILGIYYFKRGSKFSGQAKAFMGIFLLIFLRILIRSILLLTCYDLVIGTTKGIHQPRKKTATRIAYEYYHNNKLYTSSVFYKQRAITQNGKYYVRIIKFIPSSSEIDFSMPYKDKNVPKK